MKHILLLLALAFSLTLSSSAAVTGRSEDSSLAGTEKVLSDSSGTDTFILVSTLEALINKGLTIDTTTGTLDLTNGKTLAVTNTLTLQGTDSTTFTFPSVSGTVVTLDGTQTLTGKTINSATLNSPTLVTPTLGVATGTSFNGLTIDTTTGTFDLTDGKTFAVTNSLTLSGTDSTTLTLPSSNATLIGSSLSTNQVDAANSIWGASNALVFEAATANAFEISIAPADATADRTLTLPDGSGTVMVSSLSTNAPDAANGVWGASNALVLEGATADSFETTLSPVDPTADQTLSIPNVGANSALFVSLLTTNNVDAANSLWGASNGLVLEGATADTNETTITVTDPTADRTITLPNASGAPILSSGVADAANAISGGTGTLIWEGSSADTSETTLAAINPTADQTISLPDVGVNSALLVSTLTTNTVDAANSIWAASNALVFEAATANTSELTIAPADVTGDRTVTLADASGTVMLSTLATNAPDAANSVTGASAALVYEGSTADASETSVTVTDPTADRTITIPDASGTVILAQASTAVSLTADNQTVTPGTSNRIQLSSDNATDTNRTFTLSATGAITGQIYILIGPATNACEIADTGIQRLSATWSPGVGDTLTLMFDGTNFNELARSNN